MKKIVLFLFLFVCIVSCVACGPKDQNQGQSDSKSTSFYEDVPQTINDETGKPDNIVEPPAHD